MKNLIYSYLAMILVIACNNDNTQNPNSINYFISDYTIDIENYSSNGVATLLFEHNNNVIEYVIDITSDLLFTAKVNNQLLASITVVDTSFTFNNHNSDLSANEINSIEYFHSVMQLVEINWPGESDPDIQAKFDPSEIEIGGTRTAAEARCSEHYHDIPESLNVCWGSLCGCMIGDFSCLCLCGTFSPCPN